MANTQEDMVAAVLAGLGNAVPYEAAARSSTDEVHPRRSEVLSSEVDNAEEVHKDDSHSTGGLPIEPRVVQFVKISKSRQNHSYRDFSNVPPPDGYEPPPDLSSMSFAEKLHDILSQPKNNKTIRWMPHGRAFHVDIPKNMEKHGILMKYFNHGRYSSFLRQLNNHGFKHLTVGPDRNCYYHECFLQGIPHLTKYMPPSKDARRLIADPDNEPNFYAIAKAYPLPGYSVKAETVKQAETVVPAPLNFGQQLNTEGMPPPATVPVPPYSIPAVNAISPLAVILGSANNHGVFSREGTTQPVGSVFQQPNPSPTMPAPLPNVPQGTTSSKNSLLASITQGTYSFPNTLPQAPGNSPALQQPGGNTTLNLLEAWLVRQSQVTKNHEVENPSVGRPAKVPRYAQAPAAAMPAPNVTLPAANVTLPAANMTTANRIQDVAQSLATVEKFRSEAQRLEAERQKTEALQKAASANAVAAQAALLATILNGGAPSNGVNFGGNL